MGLAIKDRSMGLAVKDRSMGLVVKETSMGLAVKNRSTGLVVKDRSTGLLSSPTPRFKSQCHKIESAAGSLVSLSFLMQFFLSSRYIGTNLQLVSISYDTVLPTNILCFRHICVNTLHKEDIIIIINLVSRNYRICATCLPTPSFLRTSHEVLHC
jgi:hypothetical protein